MRLKRSLLTVLIIGTLSCNTLTQVVEIAYAANPTPAPTETASPVELATPTPEPLPTDEPIVPVYIPPECASLPLATVPPATTVAEPTPSLETNPPIDKDIQQRVFDQLVENINTEYLYEDFNGLDWGSVVATYQAKIDGGLDTEAFYTEMGQLVNELGDEHSHFESPADVALSDAELSGVNDYVGIGALVKPLPEKGRVTILSVFPESAAAHGGLKPHDSILAIDGIPIVSDGEAHPQYTRGPACSVLVITVESPGESPREIVLMRYRVTAPLPIEARIAPTSDGSRIGYIFIPTFFDETIPQQVADALAEFGHLDGLILDNRMNGGGSSLVVEPIFGYFTSGTVGYFVSRGTGRYPLIITGTEIHNSHSVPLVILVGDDTVSFGEIFSGAMRNIGRAQIVGKTTEGNVETLHGFDFDDGSRAWIAAARFDPLNPDVDWEKDGIVPDVEAFADWDTFTFETDPAVAVAVQQLGH